MKRFLGLTMGLIVAAGALYAANPTEGTWKLNESKSKIAPGTSKNAKVVYKEGLMGRTTVTVDGVGGNGKAYHSEWKGKFDGKDYKVSGDQSSDMRAYTKVNDHMLQMVSKKDGKVVGGGKVEVSADGKSRTVTVTGTNAKGKKYKSVAVYDKE